MLQTAKEERKIKEGLIAAADVSESVHMSYLLSAAQWLLTESDAHSWSPSRVNQQLLHCSTILKRLHFPV